MDTDYTKEEIELMRFKLIYQKMECVYEEIYKYHNKIRYSLMGRFSYFLFMNFFDCFIKIFGTDSITTEYVREFNIIPFSVACQEYTSISTINGILYGNGIPHDLKYSTGYSRRWYLGLQRHLERKFQSLIEEEKKYTGV